MRLKLSLQRYWFLYVLLAPGLVTLLIFAYGPMALQAVMAFTNYKFADGIFGSEWAGLGNFRQLFSMPEIVDVIVNTVVISLWSFVCGFFPSLILAIILFDLSSERFRKIAQTIVYIPYFFSWVIVYGIVYGLLSNSGIMNAVISALGGKKVGFLMDPDKIKAIILISATWKGMGWGTIIYLAAMQGIDVSLYDVAKLDGCSPLRRVFVVTLPGIKNITVFLLVLALGGLLSGGNTEQILLFINNSNISKADTIGTWVYREGLKGFEYSWGAALSFLQSTIGMVLVLIANKLSVKFAHIGIW